MVQLSRYPFFIHMQIKYSIFLSRLLSVFTWWLVFYNALPWLELNISKAAALLMACFIGGGILLFDFFIQEYRKNNGGSGLLKAILTLRFLGSIGMAWVGGLAFTLAIFWETSKQYRPTPRSRQHLTTFINMLSHEYPVVITLFLAIVALLLVDNIGRLLGVFFHQKTIVTTQEHTILQQKTEIQQQQSEITNAYQQQLELVAGIQHELGGKLALVKNTLADLGVALHDLQEKQPGFSLNNKIRMRLHGESADKIDSYNDLLQRMHAGLNYSLSTIQNIRGIIHADPSRFSPETKYLQSWLRAELPRHLPANLPVEIDMRGENPELKADYRQLSIFVHNVVENAVRHAFEPGQPPHKLLFEITINGMERLLDIHNSGTTLPDDFNLRQFFEPGKTFGRTGHSGLGGYLMGMIAASHGATINIRPSHVPAYATVVSISLKHSK